MAAQTRNDEWTGKGPSKKQGETVQSEDSRLVNNNEHDEVVRVTNPALASNIW